LNGTVLDINRRNFFSKVGKNASLSAAAVAAPALVNLNSLSDEFKAFSMEMNGKLGLVAAEVKQQLHGLNNRLDSTALKLYYQQVQLYFIFLLLALSFGIDAGMTAAWVIT
jgi:hypothetical protein